MKPVALTITPPKLLSTKFFSTLSSKNRKAHRAPQNLHTLPSDACMRKRRPKPVDREILYMQRTHPRFIIETKNRKNEKQKVREILEQSCSLDEHTQV
jgi:hypothetical protein